MIQGDPTPEQRAALERIHFNTLADLEDLVRTHACTRLNGGDRITETARLFGTLTDKGTIGALAELLAVAVDELAEKSWGAQR